MIPQAVALRRYSTLRPTPADDEALRLTVEGFFLSYGYTATQAALFEVMGEIARENRAALAAEGWVA